MLFPKIDAFGKYDYANAPVGMIPIAPNEMIGMVQDPSIAQQEAQRAAKRKSAAAGNGKRVAKKAEIDFNEMSDADAWKLREQIMSRS